MPVRCDARVARNSSCEYLSFLIEPLAELMTKKWLRDFIAASRWTFAKTMADIPHEYTLRKDSYRDRDFIRFVEFIRSHGYDADFGSRNYRYLDIDGRQYWSMGYMIDSTILINRAETGRKDRAIKVNPVPFEPDPWHEVWCPNLKKLVPR